MSVTDGSTNFYIPTRKVLNFTRVIQVGVTHVGRGGFRAMLEIPQELSFMNYTFELGEVGRSFAIMANSDEN